MGATAGLGSNEMGNELLNADRESENRSDAGVELERALAELAQAYDATLEAWARMIDLRDGEAENHSRRLAELTVKLAEKMNVPHDQLVHIHRGALLHDLGKIAVSDTILRKPGPLTDKEWVEMRRHPQHAYDILSSIAYLHPARDIPYSHHEKWDGTGYPHGLQGQAIPLSARLFAVVDVWDALSSDRSYRSKFPQEYVLNYLQEQRGMHFDPAAVDAFLQLIAEHELLTMTD